MFFARNRERYTFGFTKSVLQIFKHILHFFAYLTLLTVWTGPSIIATLSSVYFIKLKIVHIIINYHRYCVYERDPQVCGFHLKLRSYEITMQLIQNSIFVLHSIFTCVRWSQFLCSTLCLNNCSYSRFLFLSFKYTLTEKMPKNSFRTSVQRVRGTYI